MLSEIIPNAVACDAIAATPAKSPPVTLMLNLHSQGRGVTRRPFLPMMPVWHRGRGLLYGPGPSALNGGNACYFIHLDDDLSDHQAWSVLAGDNTGYQSDSLDLGRYAFVVGVECIDLN